MPLVHGSVVLCELAILVLVFMPVLRVSGRNVLVTWRSVIGGPLNGNGLRRLRTIAVLSKDCCARCGAYGATDNGPATPANLGADSRTDPTTHCTADDRTGVHGQQRIGPNQYHRAQGQTDSFHPCILRSQAERSQEAIGILLADFMHREAFVT